MRRCASATEDSQRVPIADTFPREWLVALQQPPKPQQTPPCTSARRLLSLATLLCSPFFAFCSPLSRRHVPSFATLSVISSLGMFVLLSPWPPCSPGTHCTSPHRAPQSGPPVTHLLTSRPVHQLLMVANVTGSRVEPVICLTLIGYLRRALHCIQSSTVITRLHFDISRVASLTI